MILCLYMDVISIFRTNLNMIKEVNEISSNNFEMKDLGTTNNAS